MLSELVESVEYVPLETNDKCLVGTIRIFDISDNYILVSSKSIYYLFDRKGKFLNRIGTQGQGPGEYFRPAKSLIDEANKQIIVFNTYPSQVLYYNYKGKHLRTEKMEEKALGTYLRLYNNNYFIATRNSNGDMPYAYEVRDRRFQLIKESVATVAYERQGSIRTYPGIPRDYIYDGKIYVKEVTLNDTVYSMDKSFNFRPAYRVSFGKYEITTDLRSESNPDNYFRRWPEYAQFDRTFENKNYLFLSYFYGGDILHTGYYGKASKSLLYFPNDKGIPNDYDGGLDFWPQRQDSDTWYAFYDAYRFEEEVADKKVITPKGPKSASDTFQNLYKSLDPEDNPVLVVVKLKK